MAQHLHSLLDAGRLADCAREERVAIERQALREKQRAAEAVRHLRAHRDGICRLPYWLQVNHAEACIRDALRAYRFARGNSAIQTFGSVYARRVQELQA